MNIKSFRKAHTIGAFFSAMFLYNQAHNIASGGISPNNNSKRLKNYPALPGTREKRSKNKIAKQSRIRNR